MNRLNSEAHIMSIENGDARPPCTPEQQGAALRDLYLLALREKYRQGFLAFLRSDSEVDRPRPEGRDAQHVQEDVWQVPPSARSKIMPSSSTPAQQKREP